MALIVQRKSVVPHPGHWIIRHPQTGFESRHPELTIVYKEMRSYCAANKMAVPTMADMDSWMCAQQPQLCKEDAWGTAALQMEGINESEVQAIFGNTDPTLIGNRVAEMLKAIGIPPCSGCGARQSWMNRAHQWLRDKLATQ